MDAIAFVPALTYREPKAAVGWLADAFGFELTMAIEGPDAAQSHYEMGYDGRGRIMVGGEWNAWLRSPASAEGRSTGSVHVSVTHDIDLHCARARAAGATIVAEPSDEFYGDRTYRCTDLEGHQWTFAMHVRDVSREEAEAAIATPIFATDWS